MSNQIAELNTFVTTRLAPSKIHGVGVFALDNLKKGDKLFADIAPRMYNVPYDDFNQIKPDVRQILLERWPQIINGSAFIYPDTQTQAFMNHSESANYDAFKDEMLMDVKSGEEITEDYRLIPNFDKIHRWLK